MDICVYQNKPCYLEYRVVREPCKQRTACIWIYGMWVMILASCRYLFIIFSIIAGASMLSHVLPSLFRKGAGPSRPCQLSSVSQRYHSRQWGRGWPPVRLRHHRPDGDGGRGRVSRKYLRPRLCRYILHRLQKSWISGGRGPVYDLRQFPLP